MTAYGRIASVYDELMTDVDYDSWFRHYMGILEMSSPVSRVLELGCGTGNMTFRLIRHFDVHAVDASEEMLAKARQKAVQMTAPHELTFECADMAGFEARGPFDAAIAVFDVMNCAETYERLKAVCSHVSSVLAVGGRFLFDVNTELAFRLRLFDEDVVRLEDEYAHIWRGEYDESTKREVVEMKFYKGEEKFCETHVQRAHSREEIVSALEGAGFTNVHFRDAGTMTPPTEKTDRWLVAATKGQREAR